MRCDVCVVGPVTRDIIRIVDRPLRTTPGGVVHYAASVYRALGLDTAIVTRAAPEDADELTSSLARAGVGVRFRTSPATTVFENRYRCDALGEREQSVRSTCTPFVAPDLEGVEARVIHLGPLIRSDMDTAFLERAGTLGATVALDVQGLVRRVADGRVVDSDWPDRRRGLAAVDVLKADLHEARLLCGAGAPEEAARRIAELGPREVIVTLGGDGSVVLARDVLHRIEAHPPSRLVDATGCGDTFLAAYMAHRLGSDDVAAAARFAARLAAAKLGRWGPYRAGAAGGRTRRREIP